MAARSGGRLVPPYVSYRSWESFLELLGTRKELPSRLDGGVWGDFPFSGSTRSGLKSALLFFGLCSHDYRPAEELRRLVVAPENERKVLRRGLIDRYYRPLLGSMSLERATRLELKEAFTRGGLRRETAEKAIAFCASFAQSADVTLSEQVATRKSVRRRRLSFEKMVAGRNGKESPERLLSPAARQDGDPPAGLHPAVAGLLHLLPPKGERWTAREEGLFLQAFTAAVALAHGAPPEAPELRA